MSKNILYENVDMLNVMEACEDNSKDFIMLFMPTDGRMEQNNYYTDKLNISCEVVRKLTTNGPFIYADNVGHRGWTDYDDAIFYNEKQYGDYIETISKVIQNAGRILRPQGTFCFGVPTYFMRIDKGETKDIPNINLMLQQRFTDIRKLEVPHFTVLSPKLAFLRTMGFAGGTPYTLYICGSKVRNWSEKEGEAIYSLQRVQTPTAAKFINKYEDVIRTINFPIGKTELCGRIFGDEELSELNRILISELYDDSLAEALLSKNAEISARDINFALDENGEIADFDKFGEEIEKQEKRLAEFQAEYNKLRRNTSVSFYSLLSKCLIKTFCKKTDEALFPYDRNGQYAWASNLYGMQWTSLHVVSRSREAINQEHECFVEYAYENKTPSKEDLQHFHDDEVFPLYKYADYFARIKEEDYELRTEIPNHTVRTYDANFLSSADELNEMKAQFTKYSNLIGQVVECASTGGEETYGDVEQAVHAIISLAVRAREGTGIINGDEAEKWFGEGWELLSEQCRNYLQTAAAYEKLSQQNGNADCAPIAIEFCRALELETNSVVMKPYIDYYYAHGFQDKTYKGNFKTIQKFQGAVEKQRNNSKEGMMLGQIGTCMRNAPDSVDDKNIFYSFKKYCEENDKEQLLDVDVVGEFQLVGKIRNQSAHPSLLDKGCVAQAKQLVRTALKTQLAVEAKFAHSTVLTCAVVCSPKGNKIDTNSDKMRKAVANQIEMMAQSGVKIFVLTGKFGFNQIVSDELQKYIKANANKDWGKIMVNNATDKGETSKRQKDALSKAQFCIAYYADDVGTQENDQAASISATKAMVDDAIKEHGLIVWNAYGIE